MLNEIDVFIELLDNNNIDIVLKHLNENVNSKNVTLKKLKLKKILKTNSNNKFIKKSGLAPFEFLIFEIVDKKFEKYTQFDLISYFNNDIENTIPIFEKYCTVFKLYPNLILNNLQLILKNYELKKPIFSGILEISSDEDIENYLIKNIRNIGMLKNEILKAIIGELDKKDLMKLNQVKGIVKQWPKNRKCFTQYSLLLKEYPKYIIELAYLETNSNKWQIEVGIITNILLELFNKVSFIPKSIKYELEQKNNLVNTHIKNEKLLKEEIINYKYKIKQLNKKNKDLNKKINIFENTHINDKHMLQIYENKNKLYAYNLENLKKEKLDTINMLKNQINVLKNEKKLLCEKIRKDEYTENYNKYKTAYKYCIIHKTKLKYCPKLFKNILFLNFSEINEINSKFNEVVRRNIKKIYIQRNGISSSEILFIENLANKSNINNEIVIFSNEEEVVKVIFNIQGGEIIERKFFR